MIWGHVEFKVIFWFNHSTLIERLLFSCTQDSFTDFVNKMVRTKGCNRHIATQAQKTIHIWIFAMAENIEVIWLRKTSIQIIKVKEVWLIQFQRQILRFNLNTRKANQPVIGSYLELGLKMKILPPENFRMRLRLSTASLHFIM